MLKCIVTIRRAGARPFHYTGIFPSTFDAVIDGLALTVGEQVRISARVLP